MTAYPQRLPLIMLRDAVLFPAGHLPIDDIDDLAGLTDSERQQAQAAPGLWVVVMTLVTASPHPQLVGGRGSGRPAIATLAKLTLAEPGVLADRVARLFGVARCVLIASQRYGRRATGLIRPLARSQPELSCLPLHNYLRAIKALWPDELAEALPQDCWSMLGTPLDQAEHVCNLAQGFIQNSVADQLAHLNTIEPVERLRITHHDLMREMQDRDRRQAMIEQTKTKRPQASRTTHLRLVPSTAGLD